MAGIKLYTGLSLEDDSIKIVRISVSGKIAKLEKVDKIKLVNAPQKDIDFKEQEEEIFDVFDDLEDDFEETKQSIEISADNMKALRQAYPNYFADTRQFLDILADIDSGKPPKQQSFIDKMDLSFLPKTPPPANKRVLHLDDRGLVFWGNEIVGRWEKGFYDTFYFMPGKETYYAVRSSNLREFNEDIREWLEGE